MNHQLSADLFYSNFRQYHASQGRWISPDPAGLAAADPFDPQTWNRYAYVGNSPLDRVDPLGLYFSDGGTGVCNNGDDPSENIPPRFGGGGTTGSGGSGSNPSGGTTTGIGRWPNNETLGLPKGLNLRPLSLADLLGLTPGSECDLGVCVPIGNAVVGVDDAIVIGGVVYGIGVSIYVIERYGPAAVEAIKQMIHESAGETVNDLQGCTLDTEFQLPSGAKSCAYKCKGWPAAHVTTTCQAHQKCREIIPVGVAVNPQTACE